MNLFCRHRWRETEQRVVDPPGIDSIERATFRMVQILTTTTWLVKLRCEKCGIVKIVKGTAP